AERDLGAIAPHRTIDDCLAERGKYRLPNDDSQRLIVLARFSGNFIPDRPWLTFACTGNTPMVTPVPIDKRPTCERRLPIQPNPGSCHDAHCVDVLRKRRSDALPGMRQDILRGERS